MKKQFDSLPSLKEARKRDRLISDRVTYKLEEKYLNIGENKKYLIKTHGCQANVRDSETIAGILDSLKYQECQNDEDADLIIINTCAVRDGAEQKVFGEIGALKRLKKVNPNLIIAIGGCMAQEEATIKTITSKYPQVDIVFGTHNITSLPKLLFDVYKSKEKKFEVFSKMGEIIEDVPVTRFMNHKAWVNIMYGCDKFCTYCIVPYTRGKERSRHHDDIIFEIKELIKQGFKEVCLLGQNVNAYGKDLADNYDFANLLIDAANTGIDRIRFMTSHPWDFNDSMINAIKNYHNIMPNIHLPLQSGSDYILKKMNRRYTSDAYIALFDKLKANIENCTFTTDIIVGFPNESDENFQKTLDVVDHCKYDNAFTFIYSKREGTPAATMDDKVPMEVKEERLHILNEKVAYYANLNNQKYLDQELEVLVDGLSKKNNMIYSGYSKENKLVNFTAKNVKIGDLVKVKITKVKSFSLDGVAIENK